MLMLKLGLTTPAEIAEVTIEATMGAEAKDKVDEWLEDLLTETSREIVPHVERMRLYHGIGHAIRFATLIEANLPESKRQPISDWLAEVCEAMRP
jgi:predicted nuclease with TOPRIM domain